MARIRTIKPEFFTSEDIVNLTPLSRLFYVSLWCESDREGRIDWKPKTFKLRYFPGDNCNIDLMAKELIAAKLIIIYEVDGIEFAEIPTFKEHQVINNREAESTRPSRVKVACNTPLVGKERKGKEGKDASDNASTSKTSRKKAQTSIDECFVITEAVQKWADSNGHSSLDERLSHFVMTCQAKGYQYADWDAAFRKAITDDWAKLGKSDQSKHSSVEDFMKAHS